MLSRQLDVEFTDPLDDWSSTPFHGIQAAPSTLVAGQVSITMLDGTFSERQNQ